MSFNLLDIATRFYKMSIVESEEGEESSWDYIKKEIEEEQKGEHDVLKNEILQKLRDQELLNKIEFIKQLYFREKIPTEQVFFFTTREWYDNLIKSFIIYGPVTFLHLLQFFIIKELPGLMGGGGYWYGINNQNVNDWARYRI